MSPGAFVVVVGEAGVGKTSLVRAALADTPLREGGGLSTLTWASYLPLRRAFPDLTDDTWSGDADFAADHVEEALGDAVLFVDDLQWADVSTLDVVERLAGQVPIVTGVRRGDPAAASVLERFEPFGGRQDLEPLGRAETLAWLSDLAPGMSVEQAVLVADRSGGNPLLVTELAVAGADIESLELALLARCRHLGDRELEGLGLLAVAGQPLPCDAVPELAGLVDSGMVVVSGDHAEIRHALVGEVIERVISPDRRRRCHQELARLAQHPGDTARHLLALGDRAGAHENALEAVHSAGTPGERWRYLIMAAESADGPAKESLAIQAIIAASQVGEPLEAARLVEKLSDEESPAAALARATAAYERADWDQYLGHVRAGLDVVTPGTDEEVRLLAKLATGLKQMENDPRAGLKVALQAVGKAESGGHPVSTAARVVGDCMVMAGEPGWSPWYERALDEAQREGDSYSEIASGHNLVYAHMGGADFGEARAVAQHMIRRAGELRLTNWQDSLRGFELQLAGSAGDHAHVLREIPRLLTAPSQRPLDRRAHLAVLGQTQAETGMIEEALDTAEQLRGSPAHEALAHVIRILALWMGGEPVGALAEREQLLRAEGLDSFLLSEVAPTLAWAARDAGVGTPPRPEIVDTPLFAGVVPELDGIEALVEERFADAVELFETAAKHHGTCLRRAAVHATWAAAEARRLAGGTDALVAMNEAAEVAKDSGMVSVAARCRRSLRAMGVQVASHAERPAGSPLSPREHEVAMLAGEGLTDKQIAARLGVAVRTVQTQLASARRKIGADNRAHLVALLGFTS